MIDFTAAQSAHYSRTLERQAERAKRHAEVYAESRSNFIRAAMTDPSAMVAIPGQNRKAEPVGMAMLICIDPDELAGLLRDACRGADMRVTAPLLLEVLANRYAEHAAYVETEGYEP